MPFHANKCVVSLERKFLSRQTTSCMAKLSPELNQPSTLELLTEDLKWDQQINNICDKANRTIGFLRRNLNIGATSIKEKAYFTLVWLLVEYASIVWDPYTQTNVQKTRNGTTEGCQICEKQSYRNTSSVSDMLSTMNWRSLQDRRRDASLCMMYKVDRNLVATTKDKRLAPPKRRTRHSHARAYQTQSCRNR